jgi:hypothetical protein
MVINRDDIPFLGTHDGLCGYFWNNVNIVRAASSLTEARVKEDPAFEGFRKSGNRMKEAAPIAAALYNQIPKPKKQFPLYRLLTGETLKMIKQGLDKSAITQTLYKLYIEPILRQPVEHKIPVVKAKSASRSLSGCVSIIKRTTHRKKHFRRNRQSETVNTVISISV